MTAVKDKNKKTFLYRYFDEEGLLLYVGVSVSAITRMGSHREEKEWFQHVRSITLEPFATRGGALRAEAKAIRCEAPLHNKAGVRKLKRLPRFRSPKFDDETIYYPAQVASILGAGFEATVDQLLAANIPLEVDAVRRAYWRGKDLNRAMSPQKQPEVGTDHLGAARLSGALA